MPLDIDRYSHVSSPLKRWDCRIKMASFGALIFSIALIKTLPLALTALLVAFFFIITSRLPLHFISHGIMWVTLFLFPFFIILPLSYPGQTDTYIVGIPFAIEGFRLATLIFTKAIAIVLVSFCIFGTSRFDVAMMALQELKCPKIIVQMILFTYRYTFTFLEEMKRMQTSMRARGFVPGPNSYTLKTYGEFVGTLLIRSFERTERVYKAMLSKGYQGEFHSMVTFSAQSSDKIKAGLVMLITAILLSADIFGGYPQATAGWY